MLALVLVTGLALGQTLAQGEAVRLPDGPSHAALVSTRDGDFLALAGETGIWVLDPFDGTSVLLSEASAVAVAGYDLDGDGRDEVAWCDPEGVHLVPWSLDGPGQVQSVATSATCLDLLGFVQDGREGLAVAFPDRVSLWSGLEGEPVEYEWPLTTPVLLAADEQILGLRTGGTIYSVTWSGEYDFHGSGSAPDGMAAYRGGLVYWFDRSDKLWGNGPDLELPRPVGHGASGDLDGDGLDELVLAYQGTGEEDEVGELGLWFDLEEERVSGGVPAWDLLVGDLDLDACEDVLVLDEDLVTPWLATCPGEVWLEEVGVATEAHVLRFMAHARGDLTEGPFSWSVEEGEVDCVADEDVLSCELLDQGALTVVLERLDLEGEVLASAMASVDVDNADPVFVACPETVHGFLEEGDETATLRVEYDVQDVDPVSLQLLDQPSGCHVEDHLDEGWLSLTCGELYLPADALHVFASDGDGGTADCLTGLVVGHPRPQTNEEENRGLCGCSTGRLAVLPLFLLLPLLIRVRRD